MSREIEVFIGIDPGASGGIAASCRYDEKRIVHLTSMLDTERDVFSWLEGLPNLISEGVGWQFGGSAIIEKVQGYIGQSPTTGSAMFKFGQSYGGLRMALIALNIPFEEVAPNVWQKAMGIVPRKKDEKRGDFKNRLKAKAQQLFPEVKVTLATADALLLAEYCYRKQKGTLAR